MCFKLKQYLRPDPDNERKKVFAGKVLVYCNMANCDGHGFASMTGARKAPYD